MTPYSLLSVTSEFLEKNFRMYQTSSGAHPASYPMGIGGSFSWE